ncbi:MAG: TraB/GumN family protein, partial [Vicinamibacterales bacterium]
AMLSDGKTLDQVIAPDVYAEVKRRAEKAGLPMMAIQLMKPWLVSITLMAPTLQAAGFKPELGIDRHFYDRAVASGMKRQALETMTYQLDRFDQMSPKLQEDLLKSTLEDLDKEVESVKEMAEAWGFGNVAAMEKMTLAGLKDSPELYSRLLVERNNNWIPRVESCLKLRAGCFIVVGAAHLVGPDGLPSLLAKKGYKVTQQ